MKTVSLLVFVFAGCALSHSRGNDFGSEPKTEPVASVLEANDDSSLLGSGGQPSLESEDSFVEAEEDPVFAEGAVIGASENGSGAILFDVTPSRSCTNKDLWLSLFGHGIHWEATVEITYPYSGDTIVIDEESVDDCGNAILEWVDSDQIVFRTHPSLGRLVSGFYLVSIDGSSNAVGLNLQWCDGDVQELPSCSQWRDQQPER